MTRFFTMRHLRIFFQTLRQRPRWIAAILGCALLLALGIGIAGFYLASQLQLGAAQQALDRHDLEAAQPHLQHSLSLWPVNAQARFLAAQAARRRGVPGDAERLLTEFQQRHGANEQSDLEWRLLGVQQGDFAGQEKQLQSMAEMGHPDSPFILEAMARGYLTLFLWSDAVAACDLLLNQQPSFAPGLVLRGQGFAGLRRPERALEDFERAVEVMPHSTEARLGLAETLHKLGRPREAIYHFETLRRRQPTHAAALLGLARCRLENDEIDPAQDLLDALLLAHPAHVGGRVERGRLALLRNRVIEAEEDLSTAVARAPWHREAHRLRLQCLEPLGKSDDLRACHRRLAELQAGQAEVGRLAARCRLAPRDAGLRYEIARWCRDNGEEAAAVRWLFAAVTVDPNHGPSHAALADHFARTGQPRRSAHHHQRAGLAAGGKTP